MVSSNDSQLALAICDFLQARVADGSVQGDNVDGIEIAVQMIQESFGIADKSDEVRNQLNGVDLATVFQEAVSSAKPATSKPAAAPSAGASAFAAFAAGNDNVAASTIGTSSKKGNQTPSDADKKQAEDFKKKGNEFLSQLDLLKSIESYGKAIELDGTNAIYFSNRAAAYIQNKQYDLAIEDGKTASEINPSYSKGWSRLGHAHLLLKNYDDALTAYNQALELEPANANFKTAINQIKSDMEKSGNSKSLDKSQTGGAGAGGAGGAGGFDPSSILNSLGGGAGGAGGMDFGSLLNNPNLMQMASSMMNNPEIMEMAKDPKFAQMAQQMMNGGGLDGLMKNMGGNGSQ